MLFAGIRLSLHKMLQLMRYFSEKFLYLHFNETSYKRSSLFGYLIQQLEMSKIHSIKHHQPFQQ